MVYPLWVETMYKREIMKYVRELERLTKTMLIPHLQEIESRVVIESPARADAWPDDIDRMAEDLGKAFDDLAKPMEETIGGSAKIVNHWQEKRWVKSAMKIVGVDLLTSEPWLNSELQSFTKENVTLIKDIGHQAIKDIEGTVQRGFRLGKTADAIAQEIVYRGKLKKAGVFRSIENRAKFIARDQIGKLTGNLNRLRQTSAGINMYIWRTAIDERVRTSHKIMEGLLCRWNNPTVYSPDEGSKWLPRPFGAVQLQPGEDYQCRCYGEPYFPELAKELQVGA